jgi:hypothetical protein
LNALSSRVFDQLHVLFDVEALDLFNRRIGRRGVRRLNQTAFNSS